MRFVPGAGLVKVSVFEAAETIEAERIKTKTTGRANRRTFALLLERISLFMNKYKHLPQHSKILSEESSVLMCLPCMTQFRGIDSEDYRPRRVPLHRFTCPAFSFRLGEPHPAPAGDVHDSDQVAILPPVAAFARQMQ